MQIEIAETREVDHPLRDDASIADDDDRVGTERSKLLAKCVVVLDLVGLDHRNAQTDGRLFNGRNRQFHSAAAGAVRLGNYQRHGMTSFDQSFKSRNGETRSAAKDENHFRSQRAASFELRAPSPYSKLYGARSGGHLRCWHLVAGGCPQLGARSLLPFSRFHQLLDLPLDQIALECADMRDVEFAV